MSHFRFAAGSPLRRKRSTIENRRLNISQTAPLTSKRPQMQYEDNTNSIKYHVKLFIRQNQLKFKDKVVIDAPAGAGVTSRILKDAGAVVHAYDLFPEYFKVYGMTC